MSAYAHESLCELCVGVGKELCLQQTAGGTRAWLRAKS